MNSPIFIECDADKALIVSLEITTKHITHARGESRVCKAIMRKAKVVGVTDEDPQGTHPSYLKELTLLFEDNHFRILKNRKNDSYLIVLRPRLEEWILRAGLLASVRIEEFGLPNDARKLHEIINLNLSKFRVLLDTLKQRSDLFNQLQSYLKNPQ